VLIVDITHPVKTSQLPSTSTDYPIPKNTELVVYGWGLCRNWTIDGCHGYKGNGTQACGDCGHGFGMHY